MQQELSRGNGFALWRQIAEQLKEDILAGRRLPGTRMPTQEDLAGQLGVNRHTVRRAVAALSEQGLVRVEQGRGSFVQESVIDYRVGRRTRFSENIGRGNRTPGGCLLRAERRFAEGAAAAALGLGAEDEMILLETLGEADGRPLMVAAHYFPAARFAGMIEAYRDTGSVTRAFAACGLADYFRLSTRVTARIPRAGDLRLLRQPPNRPILLTESVNVDADGRPVEYCMTRWASDRVQLLIESER
jgi:GntR family phosphonate transport system transcriptional regulator